MQRNEKLMLIRDVPAAIIDALDAVMETQGLMRVFLREIEEDWTPLLNEEGGPLVFVLSQPYDEWTAIFSSLPMDDELVVAEALAFGLEQPTLSVLLSDDTGVYGYRYFDEGVLHEEFLPDGSVERRLDFDALVERLRAHHVPLAAIDDRVLNFGAVHILVGYIAEHGVSSAPVADDVVEEDGE